MSEMKTRDSIQLSYGRLVDWQMQNPILLPGEIACVLDNDTSVPIDLKFGNGFLAFNDLPSLVNNSIVYTKEEINSLKQELDERIEQVDTALEDLSKSTSEYEEDLNSKLDSSSEEFKPTAENPLVTLKRILVEIEDAISDRFGRRLYSTAEGETSFEGAEALASNDHYYQGKVVAPEEGDEAPVVTDERSFIFIYSGGEWRIQRTSFSHEEEQVLASTITKEDVESFKEETAKIDGIEERLSANETLAGTTKDKLDEVNQSVAHQIGVFRDGVDNDTCWENTITLDQILQPGVGYEAMMPVSISDSKTSQVIKGYILQTTDGGGLGVKTEDPVFIFLENSTEQITPDVAYAVVPDPEYASAVTVQALCKVTSKRRAMDLADSHSYLRQIIDYKFSDIIHRGANDGQLKVVQNGQLKPMFLSKKLIYVDNSYVDVSGRPVTGTGIEVDPYGELASALASAGDEVKSATIIINSSEKSYENIRLSTTGNLNFVGYAVGGNSTTKVGLVEISKQGAAEELTIGFRDIEVDGSVTLTDCSTFYAEHVTFKKAITATMPKGVAYFSHCIFEEGVTFSGTGKFYLDCCTFVEGKATNISDGAVIIAEGCTGICPQVNTGASYIQFSGSCSSASINASDIAISAGGAKFVGLYGGVAVKQGEPNTLAPISLAGAQSYALGTFLFDRKNSIFDTNKDRSEPTRVSTDGLDSRQVRVEDFSKEEQADGQGVGYALSDGVPNTVTEHLKAISRKLFYLAGSATPSEPGTAQPTSGVVTTIELKTGSLDGSLTIAYTTADGQRKTTADVKVAGINTAAYREESYFAKATELTALSGRVSTAEGSLSTQSGEIEKLKTKDTELSNKISATDGKADAATAAAGRAEGAAASNKDSIDSLTTRITALEQREDSASSEDLDALKGEVAGLKTNLGKKEDKDNKVRVLDNNSSEHEKYPTVGAVVAGINSKIENLETKQNKLSDLGTDTADGTHYPTVGAVNTGLNKRVPISRLPDGDDGKSKLVTESSIREIQAQRTLIPTQTAQSNEEDVFGSIEIVKDQGTIFYDITADSSNNRVLFNQLLKGDLVSYFAYTLGDGSSIKFAHNGAPTQHSAVVSNPKSGDYYLDITNYKMKVATADSSSETANITEVLYVYSTTWTAKTISGKDITTIAKSQGRAQWTGNAWAVISSPSQSFTRTQMAAINSGIDSNLVDKLKGSDDSHSITHLSGSVYDEITARYKVSNVPNADGNMTLLTAPATPGGVLGTKVLTNADLLITDTGNDDKVTTVKTVLSIAKSAQAAATAAAATAASGAYQPKIAAKGSTDQVLMPPTAAGGAPNLRSITTTISSGATELPTSGAVHSAIESAKTGIKSTTDSLSSSLSTLQGTVSSQGEDISALQTEKSSYQTIQALWGQAKQPVEELTEGYLVELGANGTLKRSSKQASALSGLVELGSTDITNAMSGVTYVPSSNAGSATHFLLGVVDEDHISNISFKPKRTGNDAWNFGAYLVVCHRDSGNDYKEPKAAPKEVLFENCYLPILLDPQSQSTKHHLSFRGSTVFFYSSAASASEYIHTNSLTSAYNFADSTVEIDLQNDTKKFKGNFVRCTIHLYSKACLDEASTIEDSIVYFHSSSLKADASITKLAKNSGNLFIDETGNTHSNSANPTTETFTYLWRDGTRLKTNMEANTHGADDVNQALTGHIGNPGAGNTWSVSISGAVITFGAGPHNLAKTITVNNVEHAIAADSATDATNAVNAKNATNATNAVTAKNLTGGYIDLANTTLNNAGKKKLSDALTANGVAKLLSLDDTYVGSQQLKHYLTGTKSDDGGVAYAKAATSAETAAQYTGGVTVTLSSSKSSSDSSASATSDDTIVVKVGNGTTSTSKTVDTVRCATHLKVNTGGSTWEDATVSVYTITETDWTTG